MVGWFPFGKYAIMILTATMTGTVLVYAKRNPVKAHKYAIWLGVALWIRPGRQHHGGQHPAT